MCETDGKIEIKAWRCASVKGEEERLTRTIKAGETKGDTHAGERQKLRKNSSRRSRRTKREGKKVTGSKEQTDWGDVSGHLTSGTVEPRGEPPSGA